MEDYEYNFDVLFEKHLIDKENKNIIANCNESVKLKGNKRYEILKSNLFNNYLLAGVRKIAS